MVWPSMVDVTVGLGSLSSVTDATIAEGTIWSPVSPVKVACLRVILGATVSGGTAGWQPPSDAATATETTTATATDAADDLATDAATATLARYLAQ